MKNSKLSPFSFFAIIVCTLSLQSVFARDVIIRKDDPAPAQIPRVLSSMKSTSLTSVSYYPVWADLTDNCLSVIFDKPLGIVKISIENQFGMVIYQDIVDSHNAQESFIDIADWDDGTYVLKISYGNTKLKGSFDLNNK
jgi:hypothetical protein